MRVLDRGGQFPRNNMESQSMPNASRIFRVAPAAGVDVQFRTPRQKRM